MRSAKTETARATNRTFPVAPNASGDQVLLGIPLTTEPGDYTIFVSFVNEAGEERSTTLQVTVEPFATPAAGSTVPPVVLLDGWQPPGATACPMSNDATGTFGNLASYLYGSPNFAPAVYFFENCTECPNCTIEQLGADLGTFLNSIQYSNGTPVPQVDVIAHSMGGLIVRSYLSGKQQASGAFSPPAMPKIRKSIFVATPHFGSFQADSLLADVVFGLGNQTNEMTRGSQFIWDLATWNQFGDDLRGTDALAIIGNAGSSGSLSRATDGVVALTSGSLDFAKPGRTRIVNYCHIPLSPGIEAGYLGCTGPGVAYIDSPSHQTYQIVSSFLVDSGAWQSVGAAPAQDQYLSKYGGMVVADVNPNDQYLSPSSVSWGSVALTAGAVGYLYYNDIISGTGNFAFGSSTCGPYTQPIGVYSAVRCKFAPSVYSVGPLLSVPGRVVQTGTTITITGAGFGGQQCGGCRVTASNPQSTALQISSWSDTSIRALLPASFVGIAQIGVTTANGFDAINIMAAPASSIAVAPSSLQFAYTSGGRAPASQPVQIASSGGGTLNWSATTSATWLSIASASGTAPSTLSVLVSPTGLGSGSYTGSVQISAAGASNGPVSVTVTLTVTPAPASLAVSPQALTFNYTVGGTVPAAQGASITNSGGGTLNWSATTSASWLSAASASGTAPSTLSVLVSPTGLGAGTYTGSVQIAAAGASNSPELVGVTLTVAPATASLAVSPQTLSFNYTVGGAVPAAQGVSITNGGGGTLSWIASASAAWVGLSSASGTAPATLPVSVNPATLPAGQYSGTIQIAATGASKSPQTISVSLAIAAPSTLPTITSVVNGASFQPGIDSGSWVTIQGSNLANTNPGRTWRSNEVVNGNLPTSLDGVSVTIDGRTAFVYYISPTQLNVQAPTDATTGAVPVVVTNSGQVSAAFTAQLQTYGPAFFLYTGTSYAIASHFPDYGLVANPSLIPGTVAAKPGDVLILWATGFGPTNPPTPAGIAVSGAPATATAPTITVGGVPVTTISSVLSPGSAGLYQVAIQLPASVPTGAVTIQASVGGVQSPSGIVIFVSAQ
jgi:uncharacterized protein (TIGR03437 family)